MKELVFSGFQVFKNDPPKFVDLVRTAQEKWATDNNVDYVFNTTDLLTRFEPVTKELRIDARSRKYAMTCDVARLLWIKEYLKEYHSVTWIDGDFLLSNDFRLPTIEKKLPYIFKEIFMGSFTSMGVPTTINRARTVTLLKFYQSHIHMIDTILGIIFSMSDYSLLDEIRPKNKNKEYDWKIYGTTLFSTLNKLYNFPVIEGGTFLTYKSLKTINYSVENADIWFDTYRKLWKQDGIDYLIGYNLADNDEKLLQFWLDYVYERGLVYV